VVADGGDFHRTQAVGVDDVVVFAVPGGVLDGGGELGGGEVDGGGDAVGEGNVELAGLEPVHDDAAVGAGDGEYLEGLVVLGTVGERIGEGLAATRLVPDVDSVFYEGIGAAQGDAVVFDVAEAVAVDNGVPAVAGRKNVGVVSCAADHGVVARAAIQRVVAGVAFESVVPGVALEGVVAVHAIQVIGEFVAAEGVVALAAETDIAAVLAGRNGAIGIECRHDGDGLVGRRVLEHELVGVGQAGGGDASESGQVGGVRLQPVAHHRCPIIEPLLAEVEFAGSLVGGGGELVGRPLGVGVAPGGFDGVFQNGLARSIFEDEGTEAVEGGEGSEVGTGSLFERDLHQQNPFDIRNGFVDFFSCDGAALFFKQYLAGTLDRW
jgi:hypothetical protein